MHILKFFNLRMLQIEEGSSQIKEILEKLTDTQLHLLDKVNEWRKENKLSPVILQNLNLDKSIKVCNPKF